MTGAPPHLYMRQDDIARLEAMVLQLPDEAVVRLDLNDGGTLTGTVAARPAVQLFRDAEGQSGFNAVVRIDDRQRPQVAHYLWLDRIVAVTALGTA